MPLTCENTTMKKNTSYLKEILMAFTGFSLWTFSDVCVRYLSNYPTVLIAFLSSLLSVVIFCILSPHLGGFKATFTKPQLKLRIFRGLLISVSGFLSFVAFTNLDLTKAYALIFISPFIVKILSVIIMGEKISLKAWLVTTLGFSGVLVILRPGLIPIDIGSAAALGLAAFFSIGYVLTRYIDDENQTLLSMAFFQYLFLCLGMAVPAFYAYQEMGADLSFGAIHYVLFPFMSLAAISGSIIVAKAFSTAPSAVIAPIHYVQILWGAALSALIFNEYPDIWTIIGGAVIVVAGIIFIHLNRK